MIHFFRRIRRQMLDENQMIRYTRYALGEIILVVIGILIAVSINNWKEARDLEKVVLNLYGDLIQELNNDLENMRENREYNARYLKRYQLGSKIIGNDPERKKLDTLVGIAIDLTKFSDFKNNESAYEFLAASGKLDLITDKSILDQLQNLKIHYAYINRLEDNQEDFMYTIVPMLMEYIRFNTMEVIKPEELYTFQFQNRIELLIHIGAEKEDIYKTAERDIKNLISSLENELNPLTQ